MVYAVAMGKGKKVAKALTLKYPEDFSTGTNAFDGDMYCLLKDAALYDAMDSIGREVTKASPPRSASSSSGGWSDGGGKVYFDEDGNLIDFGNVLAYRGQFR